MVLGTGNVSGPCIEYLVRKGGCKVVAVDISERNISVVRKKFPSVTVEVKDAGENTRALYR
jgi:2-polyprenyl-3-methyl-5-hydroxy-6-metoxy-1,4-benzoquinol methylase